MTELLNLFTFNFLWKCTFLAAINFQKIKILRHMHTISIALKYGSIVKHYALFSFLKCTTSSSLGCVTGFKYLRLQTIMDHPLHINKSMLFQ